MFTNKYIDIFSVFFKKNHNKLYPIHGIRKFCTYKYLLTKHNNQKQTDEFSFSELFLTYFPYFKKSSFCFLGFLRSGQSAVLLSAFLSVSILTRVPGQ